MKTVYSLTSENLTNLGGPMGSEYTYDNWVKYFSSIETAKRYAEKNYNGSRGEIKWKKRGKKLETQDLGYVMYHIVPVKLEE